MKKINRVFSLALASSMLEGLVSVDFLKMSTFLILIFLSSVSIAQPPCSISQTGDATCSTPGVYICASTIIPSCLACPTSCSGANTCIYYSLRNCTSCATITAISIDIRKDPNSTKWRICRPVKNFATDCYTSEYTLSSTDLSYSGNADNCTNWPNGTSCQTYHLDFVSPTSTLSSPPCGNASDLNWLIPPGDEFSFTLCGADDGANCCGITINITWGWHDGGGNHTYTQAYACITSTNGSCSGPTCP